MPCSLFAFPLTLVALAAGPARAVVPVGQLAYKPNFLGTSFVQGLQFKQVLRVCNAFPYAAGMDVSLGTKQLNLHPMTYLTCEEYTPAIQEGDKVEFSAGGNSAGTFTISALPTGDATLLLIIYRHDDVSTAAAFESHAFPHSEATQVAIIDTYKGTSKTVVRIEDMEPKPRTRSELLRYDSVVAIKPGLYNVELVNAGNNGSMIMTTPFVAAPRNVYVVVRCGVATVDGKAYQQEVMIYPQSDKVLLGAANPLRSQLPWLAAAVLLAFSV